MVSTKTENCKRTFVTKVSLVIRATVCYRPVYQLEMTPSFRLCERILIPRTALCVRQLQHLEVPAQSCVLTRVLVPRCVVLAQQLQLFELSTPRRCLTKEFLTQQKTLPLQALQCSETSKLYGGILIKLLKSQPRFRHRVAHRTAHRWEPCEICGVVKVLRSENVRDDEVVREAREGLARVSRGSIADIALSLTRASFRTDPRVGRHREGGVCAWLCASSLPRKALRVEFHDKTNQPPETAPPRMPRPPPATA